jgi:chaperonin GroES
MKIKPLGDYIVIEPLFIQEKTKSGIYLPDSADKEEPEQGKVIAIGPGKRDSVGKLLPLEVKIGEQVLFSKYGPTKVKFDNKEYFIIRQDDILGIIEK